MYCDQKGYAVAGRYFDKAVSGGLLIRPGLQTVLDKLESGDMLVVASSDRLARDMLTSLTIRQQVIDAGAMIEYADGTPPGTTPEGLLFQNILAAFASYERAKINARTKAGHEKRRKNGERTTGQIPIGWKPDPRDPKKLVVQAVEREAIINMCELSFEGYYSSQIAKALDRRFGPCREKPWSARTVRHLIRKHSYWAGPDGDYALEPDHP